MRLDVWVAVAVLGASFGGDALARESWTLKKIRETGVISLGYREASIPFSYLDDKQRPIGYSMDICHRVVEAVRERLKLRHIEVRFTPVTSANRTPLMVNDIVDLECGTTTNTLERQNSVGFAVTTFVAASRLVSKKAANIRSADDLKGRSVVTTAGTTSMDILQELNRKRGLDMYILAATDHAESFRMVETDRAYAFAMDDILLYGLVANARHPDDFEISEHALSVEPYALMLRKDDTAFKKVVDDAIVGLFRSGEIETIYRKWFQSPIPPKGINLRVPMSSALRKVIATPTDSGDPARYR